MLRAADLKGIVNLRGVEIRLYSETIEQRMLNHLRVQLLGSVTGAS